MQKRIFLVVLVLLVAGIACDGLGNKKQGGNETENVPPAPMEEEVNSPEPQVENTPVPEDEPEPEEQSPSPTPEEHLEAAPLSITELTEGEGLKTPGPWLLLNRSDGFFLVSQDGTWIGKLPFRYDTQITKWMVSPQGGAYAALHVRDFEKILEVRLLPENTMVLDLNMTDYAGEMPSFDNEQDAYQFEADRRWAVGEMAWSRSGEMLAFVSSHLGPTPDIYTFDLRTSEVTQVTNGPAHAVMPVWSPGDAYIFHAGVLSLFAETSGSGHAGWVFYAASPDGSSVLSAGSGLEERGEEEVVGWFDDMHVLMQSGYWWCGYYDFRLLNIGNGEQTPIWKDQYDLAAYDPIMQMALLWVSSDAFETEDCGPVREPGLYLVYVPDGFNVKVENFDSNFYVQSIKWVRQASKFVLDLRTIWLLVDVDGLVQTLNEEPFYSPDGLWIALLGYEGESLRIYGHEVDKTIEIETGGEVMHPTWSPDSGSLFYFEEGDQSDRFDLYMASAPDFAPVLLAEEMQRRYDDTPQWVNP